MKTRISITIEENNLKLIEELLEKNPTAFRNKSHLVECSLIKFLGEEGK
ncbi:hypothetical protein J4474_04375 [Candidatus Pacearchaeota archaeon]|nr:hypothetical protein [Candidatus Pacearchaeota archaeon]